MEAESKLSEKLLLLRDLVQYEAEVKAHYEEAIAQSLGGDVVERRRGMWERASSTAEQMRQDIEKLLLS